MKVQKPNIIQLGNAIVAQIILVERSTLIVISKIVWSSRLRLQF